MQIKIRWQKMNDLLFMNKLIGMHSFFYHEANVVFILGVV
jgi:hypothetical protein